MSTLLLEKNEVINLNAMLAELDGQIQQQDLVDEHIALGCMLTCSNTCDGSCESGCYGSCTGGCTDGLTVG